MRRYLSKFALRYFLGFLFLVLVFTCSIDVYLSFSKDKLSNLAEKYFTQKLSVKSAFYAPPNFIFLKDVSFSEDASAGPRRIIFVPRLSLKFSLLELLLRREFSISELGFYRPDFDYTELKKFLRDNFERVIDFIEDLPIKDVRLKASGFSFTNLGKMKAPGFIQGDFFLRLKDQSIVGWGTAFRQSGSGLSGPPTSLRFGAFLTYGGCTIENFEVMRENLYAKLWGSLKSSSLKLNGFAFINTLYKDSSYRQPVLTLFDRISDLIKKLEVPSDVVGLPKANVFILDIDGQMDLKLPQLDIARLNFSFNNAPVSIKGGINFSDTIGIDISASSFMTRLKDTSAETLRRADLTLKGTIDANTLLGDGKVDFDFVAKKKKGNPPLDNLSLDFKKMALNFERFPVITMDMEEADLVCTTDTNTYRINLRDLRSQSVPGKYKFNKIEIASGIYDGVMKAKGWIDWSVFPPAIKAFVRVKDLSSDSLDGVLVHFSKVFGELSGQMRFVNYPEMNLKGSVAIHNGMLVNFEFFKWLSDLFALPSLKKVDFRKARFNFSVDSHGAGISGIGLDAQQTGVGGYFTLGENDMVSSKLNLTLKRNLLRESPKFLPLLRLIEKDIESLRFDFQLSGNLHRMNFQWLKSDLKNQLQDSIPHFIEWQIEKKVQDIIDSIDIKTDN